MSVLLHNSNSQIRRLITGCLLMLNLQAVAEEAGGYGFGEIQTLGSHDILVRNESLRVLSADTVGFVYYQQGRRLSGPLDNPEAFTIMENGRVLSGHQVLGRFVKLHHMGHVPEPYLPATLVGVIYIKLARPMEEGKTYTFRSKGIGADDADVSFLSLIHI